MSKQLPVVSFDYDVKYHEGTLELIGYEDVLRQAEKIRDELSLVIVTPDTLQANKKLVASVRKSFEEIDNWRKAIKKKYMEPYFVLEEQVKTIGAVVSEAENTIRTQIKELENQQREQKDKDMRQMFDTITEEYGGEKLVDYSDFARVNQSIFNKSVSLTKVEKLIREFLIKVGRDFEAFQVYVENNDDITIEDCLFIYKKNDFDLGNSVLAIDNFKKEKMEIRQSVSQIDENSSNDIEEELDEVDVEQEDEDNYILIYINEKDYQKTIDLLLANNIDYIE